MAMTIDEIRAIRARRKKLNEAKRMREVAEKGTTTKVRSKRTVKKKTTSKKKETSNEETQKPAEPIEATTAPTSAESSD